MTSLLLSARLPLLPVVASAILLVACSGEIGSGAYLDHEEDEDFVSISSTVPGIPEGFLRNNVVSDEIFTDQALTADIIQGFFEHTPYNGSRSWLADVEVSGMRASDALVAAANSKNINPLMLLARLQVERSAVSRTQRPSQHNIDYAMGCGCLDNQACNTAFKGFDKQMECAANTLRKHFDGSVAGTGQWRKGKSTKSLDPLFVTPVNHATASLYSYTPWVLQGAGGNWLVWNVTKKYATALQSVTPVTPPGGGGGGTTDPDPDPSNPDPTGPSAFVGTVCEGSATCNLSSSGVNNGECVNWFDADTSTLFGFCSYDCSGFCTDISGQAPTFCTQIQGAGQCAAQPSSLNGNCSGIPGTKRISKPRHVGSSGAEVVWKDVCVAENEAVSCTKGGQTGVCTNTSTNTCSGTLVTGACSGPSNIRCCLP